MPWKAQVLWQNKSATKCSIQRLQSNSESHTRGFAQGVTKGLPLAQPVPQTKDEAVQSAKWSSVQQVAVAHSAQYLLVMPSLCKTFPLSALPLSRDLDLEGEG